MLFINCASQCWIVHKQVWQSKRRGLPEPVRQHCHEGRNNVGACIIFSHPGAQTVKESISEAASVRVDARDYMGIRFVPFSTAWTSVLDAHFPDSGNTSNRGHMRNPIDKKMLTMEGQTLRCEFKANPVDERSVYAGNLAFLQPILSEGVSHQAS